MGPLMAVSNLLGFISADTLTRTNLPGVAGLIGNLHRNDPWVNFLLFPTFIVLKLDQRLKVNEHVKSSLKQKQGVIKYDIVTSTVSILGRHISKHFYFSFLLLSLLVFFFLSSSFLSFFFSLTAEKYYEKHSDKLCHIYTNVFCFHTNKCVQVLIPEDNTFYTNASKK